MPVDVEGSDGQLMYGPLSEDLLRVRQALAQAINSSQVLPPAELDRFKEVERQLRALEARGRPASGSRPLGRQLLLDLGLGDRQGEKKARSATEGAGLNQVLTENTGEEANGRPDFAKRKGMSVQWQSLALQELMAKVSTLDVDVVPISQQPEVGGKIITAMLLQTFNTSGVFANLPDGVFAGDRNLLEERLVSFMLAVDDAYLNPLYHNSKHGADVMMMMHWLFQSDYLKASTTPVDHFMCLISAGIHDMGHNGMNNIFHMKTASPVAVRYNDRSVLENMHISLAFQMMRVKEELNWFTLLNQNCTLPGEGKATNLQDSFRKGMVELVLQTDVTRHGQQMADLKALVAETEAAAADGDRKIVPVSAEKKLTLLGALLHTADVSNPARPQPIMLFWCRRVLLEFWNQGDEERSLGLPISMLCDRTEGLASIPKGQLGFVNFMVKPLFVSVSQLIPEVSAAVQQLDNNVAFWTARNGENAAFSDIFASVDDEEVGMRDGQPKKTA